MYVLIPSLQNLKENILSPHLKIIYSFDKYLLGIHYVLRIVNKTKSTLRNVPSSKEEIIFLKIIKFQMARLP